MTTSPQTGLDRRMAAAASAVDAMLMRLLPEPGEDVPDRLAEAMRYAALGPGKRLRPFLVIEAAGLAGAAGEGVVRAGAALELVHAYSLVHDDLPAMDDDDLRRGRPTVHRAFDEATAILVGDALQALAFAVLADPATHPDPAVRIRLVATLAAAAGPAGMVGGQALDMSLAGGAASEPAIRAMQAMKTGALIRAACVAGGIVGGASPGLAAALDAYGARLGFAFQLADDLLDATGSAVRLGKAAGKDAARGKQTLVALHGVDGARAILDGAVAGAIATLTGLGPDAGLLRAAAAFIAEREH